MFHLFNVIVLFVLLHTRKGNFFCLTTFDTELVTIHPGSKRVKLVFIPVLNGVNLTLSQPFMVKTNLFLSNWEYFGISASWSMTM